MKRVRLHRWAAQLQPPRNPRLPCTRPFSLDTPALPLLLTHRMQNHHPQSIQCAGTIHRRAASTAVTSRELEEFDVPPETQIGSRDYEEGGQYHKTQPLNAPSYLQASESAKLSALHARLSLPSRLPLEVLARCLIDPSVDHRAGYNNAPFALLGQDLLGYYTAEYLMCRYPRLPLPIIFAAQYAYVGPATLAAMRAEWGVEVVAAPGPEVDPGLLQLKRQRPGNAMMPEENVRVKDRLPQKRLGPGRRNDKANYRRGMSSRIVFDDQFGDPENPPSWRPGPATRSLQDGDGISARTSEHAEDGIDVQFTAESAERAGDVGADGTTVDAASASFVRALTGALHTFGGDSVTKAFHRDHVLSRHLELHNLFHFTHPTRDLSRLCARERLEPPVARLISETGRLSRTPVFVVGVYSGDSKLGEGAGSSLNEARVRAAAGALRSWYLYSPPDSNIVYPSEVEGDGGKKTTWKPQMIDVGEVIA